MEADASIEPQVGRYTLGIRGAGLILGFGLSLLIVYHCAPRALTRHEIMYAQSAREMLAGGNWLVPTIAGEVWPEKPPLTSWLIAGVMAITGSQAEWAARLPSSLASLLTALLIAATAARFLGRRIGILAGLMQFTSFYQLHMMTLAESDMPLIAGVTACFCLFAWVQVESPLGKLIARWTPWAFHFFLGLTYLIKGPLGVAFVALGTGTYMLWQRQWSCLRFFFHPGGLILFLLCALPYPILAGWREPMIWEQFLQHNLGRLEGVTRNEQPIYFYAYALPMVLLPWLPCLVLGLLRKEIRQQELSRLGLCWFLPGFLLLQCIQWKWFHYPYPLLPGLTFLAAPALDGIIAQVQPQRFWRWLVFPIGAVGIGALVAVDQLQPVAAPVILLLIGLIAVSGWTQCIQMSEGCSRQAVGLHVATLWVVIVGVYGWILPANDNCAASVEFARRINARQDLEQPIYLVDAQYDQIIYYLQRPPKCFDNLREFVRFAAQSSGPLDLLVRDVDMPRIEAVGALKVLDRCPPPRARANPRNALVLVRLQRSAAISSVRQESR